MRRLLATVILALSLVAPAVADPFTLPAGLKTFSGMTKDPEVVVKGSNIAGCPSGAEVYVLAFTYRGDGYTFWFAPATGRMLWAVYPGDKDGAAPALLGVGTIDPARPDEIPALVWMSFEEGVKRYPGPCNWLAPITA